MRYPYLQIALTAVTAMTWAARAQDTTAFIITDDPALDAAVAQARADTLAVSPFTRLDATILVEQPDGTWRRGSYNPDATAYPASCVKLAYLAAAMRYQADHGLAYDSLDASVRPMITVSSNIATGEVVDAITETTNLNGVQSTSSQQWPDWYAARLYTENYLTTRGLLGNQNVVNKTYPTNSGSSPTGAEGVLFDVEGGNLMQPRLSASLMLEVVGGAIEADTGLVGSTDYMRDLLTHDRVSDYSSIGFGLPPGTLYENKIGLAYDTLEDIAHFVLPNGNRVILSVFSNGWNPSTPLPYDAAPLGTFAELLLDRAGLTAGNPPKVVVDSAEPSVTYAGSWPTGSAQPDKFGPSYRYASGGHGSNTATFTLNTPETGDYEVWAWWPASSNRATDSPFTINHRDGSETVRLNQQIWGGRWVLLGTYPFNASTGTVVLSDDTADQSKLVLSDAVKAVKVPGTGCPADVNGDGFLDNGDISAFIAAFLSGDLIADFNGDTFLDNGDISAFIAAFLTGC